jgi:hypothetical protein
LFVARANPENVLEALLRQSGVRRDRQHRHTASIEDSRCGNGYTRVVGSDDGDDAAVNKLLCNLHTDFRVRLVVFRIQFEGDLLSRNCDAVLVQFINGEASAVLVVFAIWCLRPRERCRMTDSDHDLGT